MDTFRYELIDLERPAFRLLRLFKGGEPDIECELFQAWLHGDSTIPYEALSYTWGDREMYECIRVNGRRLGITRNLYQALYHLRLQDTDRILWVDAICIDQGNERERGHQVQQMGNIYSQADKVIFWLGLPTRETNVLMDSLKQLQEKSATHPYMNWKPSDERWADLWSSIQPTLSSQHSGLVAQQRGGMKLLLGQSWFKRVWILQEVANSKSAVVCCGTKSVPANFFALAPLLIGMKPEPHCQAVLDIMPGPSRKDSWWSQKRGLYTLLLKFRESEASDERDMIYALLGISSDALDNDILRADYTKTTYQVVCNTMSFLFGSSHYTCLTVSELLHDFNSLNTKYFCRVARSCNADDIAAFLKERGAEVRVTKGVVKAAAGNVKNGKEVMALLLEKRGREVHVRGEEVVTEEVIIAAAGNTGSGKEVMALLLEKQGEEVVIAIEQIGRKMRAGFHKKQEGEVKVTGVVVWRTRSGKEVLELLFAELLRTNPLNACVLHWLSTKQHYVSHHLSDKIRLELQKQESGLNPSGFPTLYFEEQ